MNHFLDFGVCEDCLYFWVIVDDLHNWVLFFLLLSYFLQVRSHNLRELLHERYEFRVRAVCLDCFSWAFSHEVNCTGEVRIAHCLEQFGVLA
jgi:hypothetical protein